MRSPKQAPFGIWFLVLFCFIRKQNNFVLRYPLDFRKPETYLRFYVYTCPIYFKALTCLGKICDPDINRILKQFHFFVPFRPRKCCLIVSSKCTKPNQYIIQNQGASGFYRCSTNFMRTVQSITN